MGRELVERGREREGNGGQPLTGRMRKRAKQEVREREKEGGCLLLRDEKLVSIVL